MMTIDEAKRTLDQMLHIRGLPESFRASFEGIRGVIEKQQRRIRNQARELTKLKGMRETHEK